LLFVVFTKSSEGGGRGGGVHYSSFLDSFPAYLGTGVKVLPTGDIKEEGKILFISLLLISLGG